MYIYNGNKREKAKALIVASLVNKTKSVSVRILNTKHNVQNRCTVIIKGRLYLSTL